MNFNIFNSLILAGVIQGFIFGALVWLSKKYRHKSVYFLVTVIVVYSLSNLQYYFEDIGLITLDQLYAYWYIPWGNTVPALLYFYVVTYLSPSRIIKWNEKLLFIPFIISFIISVIYKVGLVLNIDSGYIEGLRFYMEIYDEFISAAFHIAILIILLVKIRDYIKANSIYKPNHIRLHVKWLSTTFIAMLVLAVVWILLTRLYMLYPGEISFYPLWITMAALIYWLGHIGIYKYGIVEQRNQIRKKQQAKPKPEVKGKTKHIIVERLKHFLENEKRFLDSELNLEKTSKALDISQGHLSKIINTELGSGFKDYINTLRVEEAKSYLLDSEFSNYTLVAIGLEAGFNSKSAFNSSFKKITGETPSQFKQRHAN